MFDDLAILVNSCDKYEDTWYPFFKLLQIQWENHPKSIYLNTENKKYECPFMDVKTICTGNEAWTERVKNAVMQIEQEYVLFMLDDFFVLDKVDEEKFGEVFDDFKTNKDVGFAWFYPLIFDKKKSIGKCFIETPKTYKYRVGAGLALWRKDFLLMMLYQPADPWLFETRASKLSLLTDYKVAYVASSYLDTIPHKIDPVYGYGITAGKWLNKNKALFDKYGIEVDFSKLGVFEEDITYATTDKWFEERKKANKKPSKIKNFFKSIGKGIKKFFVAIGRFIKRAYLKVRYVWRQNIWRRIKQGFHWITFHMGASKYKPAFKKYCKVLKKQGIIDNEK